MKIKNIALLSSLCITTVAFAQKNNIPQTSLKSDFKKVLYGFRNIQDSTKTKTWWFHGKTASSKEGITKDLEAFHNAGIGGVVFYDQTHGNIDTTSEAAMSKEWWDNIYHAAREADRLGIGLEFHVSNGFVAGGPWIEPKDAMKRVETIETIIKGGKDIEIALESPKNRYNYFKDIRILAIPTEDSDNSAMLNCNNKEYKAESFFINNSLVRISPTSTQTPLYINVDFLTPKTLRSITYQIGAAGKATTSATNIPAPPQEHFTGTGYRILPPVGELQWSEDGEVYYKLCDIKPLYRAHESYKTKTLSFNEKKARFFRIKLEGWDGSENGTQLSFGGVKFSSDAMINEYEYKAAYISEYIDNSLQSPAYTKDEVVLSNKIIDLSDKVSSNGILKWKAPEGKWKILRICMIPTGGILKHGRPNLLGLECDKMSASASKLQFDSYFGKILDSLTAHKIYNLKGIVMDSHEAGSQNWTDDFIEAFHSLRGYDPAKYLPVMSGYAVNSIKESEGFLYDVRLTISELIAKRYYGTIDKLSKDRNIVFTAQATGNAQCIVAIPLIAKKEVQKPQGEFWVIHPEGSYDIKETSSAAHLYGKNIASAEAFTDGTFRTMPHELKNIADGAYSFGINEFVLCASAHQPDDRKPGNSGGRVYSTYTRNNTWFNISRDFWNYQSRCAYIMRQGLPVTDLCIYLGNNAPLRLLTNRLPLIPNGYDYDVFSEDALINRMSFKDGRITLPSGQTFSMMVLPRSGEMTLNALRKIASLVKEGAIVYGNRPTGSPDKLDIGQESEYDEIVTSLWDKPNYGKGKVYSSMTLAEALSKASIQPDIDGPKLYFNHRKAKDCDIYFLNNHSDSKIDSIFKFKTQYKHAQLWNAVTGNRYMIDSKSGETKLALEPRESFFIVFSNIKETLPKIHKQSKTYKIDGNWNVYFDEKMNGIGNMTMNKLVKWNDSDNPNIKYYSGTAIYKNKFNFNANTTSAMLKLPKGDFWAEIYLNSHKVGTIWCSPWNIDISKYIKKGENNIEIHITNAWTNRMIGDLSLPTKDRITTNPEEYVNNNSKLQDSGIDGEIEIIY